MLAADWIFYVVVKHSRHSLKMRLLESLGLTVSYDLIWENLATELKYQTVIWVISLACADLLDSTGLSCHDTHTRLLPTHMGIDLIQDATDTDDLERGIKKKQHAKIVGGQRVDHIQSWPFLGHAATGCSLSLISSKVALTAAHCCDTWGKHQDDPKVTFFFGSTKFQGGVRVRGIKYRKHPDYTGKRGFHHDLCLVKLNVDLDVGCIENGLVVFIFINFCFLCKISSVYYQKWTP